MSAEDMLPPQARFAAWLAANAAKLVAGVLVAALFGFMLYQTFFAAGRAKAVHAEAAAQAGGLVNGAKADAGGAAVNTVAGNAAKESGIRERTITNYVEITKQPGAADPITDELDAAGRRAICLRASAAGLPDCQRLREADSQGMEEGRP